MQSLDLYRKTHEMFGSTYVDDVIWVDRDQAEDDQRSERPSATKYDKNSLNM